MTDVGAIGGTEDKLVDELLLLRVLVLCEGGWVHKRGRQEEREGDPFAERDPTYK